MDPLDLIMELLDAGCWLIHKCEGRNNLYFSPITNTAFTIPTLKMRLPSQTVKMIRLSAGLK